MKDKLKIQIHHLGGIEGCGPTERLAILWKDAQWTFYDADKDSLNQSDTKDKDFVLINKCIGKIDGPGKFNIMKTPSASSVFECAESAKEYLMPDGTRWGDHTQIVKTIDIELNKLDTLIKNKEVKPIDFLSMDIQGSELDVLDSTDLSDVLGILCEINYTELYENQPLTFDIYKKAHLEGFRLCLLYNPQYFRTDNNLLSDGFLTVEEVLFLRDPKTISDPIKLIKLAMMGMCFKQPDFATKILLSVEEELNKLPRDGYIGPLQDLVKEIKTFIN